MGEWSLTWELCYGGVVTWELCYGGVVTDLGVVLWGSGH